MSKPTSTKKVWPCEHIKWYPAEDGYPGAWTAFKFDINGTRDIPRSWTRCPICNAIRPVKRKERK